MLTNAFYVALASALKAAAEAGDLSIAVGGGDPAWDADGTPREDRRVDGLGAEVARKTVPADRAVFLDENGRPARAPTTRLQLSVTFGAGEAAGTLRECGLFREAGRADGPSLLSYFTHPRVEKAEAGSLSRVFRIDVTPRPIVAGSRETRYLANAASGEFHDLENTKSLCQIEEIRVDRRFYLRNEAEAAELGYDFCAYCFGRDRSRR